MEEAIRLTKRPRHMEAALYHLRREGTPVLASCQLSLIQGHSGRVGLISVLRLKDLWSRGVIPPLTPSEEAAMRTPYRRRA